jgi:hypothetical protein
MEQYYVLNISRYLLRCGHHEGKGHTHCPSKSCIGAQDYLVECHSVAHFLKERIEQHNAKESDKMQNNVSKKELDVVLVADKVVTS